MAVDQYALTTLAGAKRFMGITGTANDTLIEELIDSVSDAIESWCRVKIKQRTFTEYHPGQGYSYVFVDNPPIISVTSVYDDIDRGFSSSYLVDSSYYTTDGSYAGEGRIQLWQGKLYFQEGIMNVKVTYSGGYAAVPDDVEMACNALVSMWYNIREKQGLASETIDDYRYTMADEKEVQQGGMPSHIQALLGPFQRYAI
ncbi:phage gp6-like head-tail connector protein [bacterium]|nr:phage gp6-like head-tail connector protein [bacterium]